MTEQSKVDEAFEQQTSALKPDFREIGEESLNALVRTQYGDDADIEVFDVGGGSEASGMSSGIVLFKAKVNGDVQDLVLRYAPYGNEGRIFVDYDIEGQYNLQRLLSAEGAPVPNAVSCDPDGKILPYPGFVMERVEGRMPDNPAYTSGLFGDATQAERDSYRDEIFGALEKIHTVDWQRLGLDKHCRQAEGRTHTERYLSWFWKTAEWAGFEKQTLSRIGNLRQWLVDNQPTYHPDDMTLMHGDSNLANYMFHDGKLVAILDWELAGIGQPSLDIVMQCNFNDYCRVASPPEVHDIIPNEEEWIAAYTKVTGRELKDLEYYRAVSAYCGLIIMNSIFRSIPKEHLATYSTVIDPLWEIADNPRR